MSQVILLTGYRGSGKDTAAEYLSEHYGYVHLSLADPLKDMVAGKYGILRSHLDHRIHKEAPILRLPVVPSDTTTAALQAVLEDSLRSGYWTPRALCILEGSVARAVHPDYWTRRLLQEIAIDQDSKYVVSDVRYRTEIEATKVLHPRARVVHIVRGKAPDTQDSSERDLEEYTDRIRVDNNGTLEELYAQLDDLLN